MQLSASVRRSHGQREPRTKDPVFEQTLCRTERCRLPRIGLEADADGMARNPPPDRMHPTRRADVHEHGRRSPQFRFGKNAVDQIHARTACRWICWEKLLISGVAK